MESALNFLIAVAILGGAFWFTQWFAGRMYLQCRGCGTLNARRRSQCRQCGNVLREGADAG